MFPRHESQPVPTMLLAFCTYDAEQLCGRSRTEIELTVYTIYLGFGCHATGLDNVAANLPFKNVIFCLYYTLKSKQYPSRGLP